MMALAPFSAEQLSGDAALHPSELVHNANLQNIATACLTLDGRFRDANAAFLSALGFERDALLNTSLFAVTHPIELLSTFGMMKKLLTCELQTWEADRMCLDVNGETISVHLTLTTMYSPENKPRCVV